MPKLTFELIDWTAVPPPFNFITQDGNGRVMMHTLEPEPYAHNAKWNGAGIGADSPKMSRPFNGLFPEWEDTLKDVGDGWQAMDSDGGWYWYDYLPVKLGTRWGHSGQGSRLPLWTMIEGWGLQIWERPYAGVGIML